MPYRTGAHNRGPRHRIANPLDRRRGCARHHARELRQRGRCLLRGIGAIPEGRELRSRCQAVIAPRKLDWEVTDFGCRDCRLWRYGFETVSLPCGFGMWRFCGSDGEGFRDLFRSKRRDLSVRLVGQDGPDRMATIVRADATCAYRVARRMKYPTIGTAATKRAIIILPTGISARFKRSRSTIPATTITAENTRIDGAIAVAAHPAAHPSIDRITNHPATVPASGIGARI